MADSEGLMVVREGEAAFFLSNGSCGSCTYWRNRLIVPLNV